jgi:sugar/nucleoside kinase (ribokinase family)
VTGPRVLVVGDVINDILVVPGRPVAEGQDNQASILARPGGSAANQAAWMGCLGLDVVFAGRAGLADAESHRAELARFGVDARLATDASAATGSIVVLVGTDGERTMITDRGANLRLRGTDVPFSLLDGVVMLHLTGYTLVSPGPRAVALALIEQARRRGIPFSVDPGSWAFLAGLERGEFVRWTAGAAACFPNADEATVLTGESDPAEMAIRLGEHYGAVMVKLGADGVVLATGGGTQRFPARPATVRDTTGAGDAFCAGFLAAWLRGASAPDAVRAGTGAAATAVSLLGGRPAPAPPTGGPRTGQG